MGWVWIEMYFLHTRRCVLCQSIGSRKSNQNSSSFYGFLETLGTRFCSICFCFVFPRSLFVVLVIIIIFLYPFQCVGGVGGSLWIMMIRPQTRLFSIPVDSDSESDSVPIRPSIQLSIHPSVQQPISLSRRLDYWFIVCFLGLCRTGKRERNRHGYAKRSAHRNVSRALLFVSPSTMQIHFWSARFSISYVVVINLTTTTSSDNKRAQKN